jgi:DNA polymerase III psi subunit
MYIEKNAIALQQLFAGENIYLLKDEFVDKTLLSVPLQTTVKLPVETQTTTSYYQPKQKVVIILTSLNTADSELFGKILGAVKLDLQSVDIIELAQNKDVNLSQIFVQKSVNQVITFGINLSELKLDVPLTPYQILEKQGIKFIYSDSLSDIQNDIPKKKALWGSLKGMF